MINLNINQLHALTSCFTLFSFICIFFFIVLIYSYNDMKNKNIGKLLLIFLGILGLILPILAALCYI